MRGRNPKETLKEDIGIFVSLFLSSHNADAMAKLGADRPEDHVGHRALCVSDVRRYAFS